MIKVQRIIVTPGEPAGIGPDLVVRLAQQAWPVELVICADPQLLVTRAKKLQLPLILHPYNPNYPVSPRPAGELTILKIFTSNKVIPGKLDVFNSNYVISSLIRACDGCLKDEFKALVTGPVHKGIINDSGILFHGHTNFLAKHSKSKQVVMMLVSNMLRVALVTTHLPLSLVSKKITSKLIYDVINILTQGLQENFCIPHPRIHVCSLNPHAGEGGHIGLEENKIIIPALNTLRAKGYNITGPLPADTLFQTKYLQNTDVILAMYHDQGLPVIKYQSFGKIVNITLGLPFIRTSVDHGTALELAGTLDAKIDSFEMAINMAINIANNK